MSTEVMPVALTADADWIYGIGGSPGPNGFEPGIFRFAKPDGPLEAIAPVQVADVARSILVDDDSVYWAEQERVWRAPKAGGTPSLMFGGPNIVASLAQDDVAVYSLALDGTGLLFRIPKDGSAAAPLAQLTGSSLVVDSSYVYWVGGAGHIYRVSSSGGPVETQATFAGFGGVLRLSGASLCWTVQSGVLSMSLGGGDAVPLTTKTGSLYTLDVDADHAYWGADDGTIHKAPLAGGAESVIASGPPQPISMLVDEEYVYWGTFAPSHPFLRAKKK